MNFLSYCVYKQLSHTHTHTVTIAQIPFTSINEWKVELGNLILGNRHFKGWHVAKIVKFWACTTK